MAWYGMVWYGMDYMYLSIFVYICYMYIFSHIWYTHHITSHHTAGIEARRTETDWPHQNAIVIILCADHLDGRVHWMNGYEPMFM